MPARTVIPVGLFIVLRLALAITTEPIATFDTADYQYMAERGVAEIFRGGLGEPMVAPVIEHVPGIDFPLTEKPPMTAMVHKAMTGDDRTIVVVQALLGALSWAWLAWEMRRRLGAIGFAGTLLVGSTPSISVWDSFLLSDSLSLSGLAATLAALLRLGSGWTTPRFGWLCVVAFVFSMTRDLNAYLLVGVGLVIAVTVACGRAPKRWLAVSALGLVLFVGVTASARAGERHLVPLYHVVSQNILPSADLTERMEANGMPVTPELMRWSEEIVANGYGTDPAIPEFHRWIRHDGQAAYVQTLLDRPGWALSQPFANLPDVSAAAGWFMSGSHGSLDNPLTGLVVARSSTAYSLQFGIVASGLVLAVKMRRRQDTLILGLLPLVIAGWLMANFHGDGNEYGRHAKEAMVLLALGVVWSLALWRTRLKDGSIDQSVPTAPSAG